MAIVGRDLDVSERKEVFVWMNTKTTDATGVSSVVAQGVSSPIALVPYPCTIESIRFYAEGVSLAMQVAPIVNRFVVGSGLTSIQLGISNVILQNFSLSGMVGYSGLAATGSTLLSLAANDVLGFQTSVTNSSAKILRIEVAVRKTQDILSVFGTA
jgi:hypothetical protein